MSHQRQVAGALAGVIPVAFFLLAGCSSRADGGLVEPSADTPDILAAKGGGGGKPAPSTVALAMTVADGSAYQVQSDGLGEYVNGVDGMGLTIDGSGNLQISAFNLTSSTPPVRRLRVSYPAGLTDTYPEQWNFKVKSNKTNNENPAIQDMAVGASLCYNVTISHATQAIAYYDNFNPALNAGASYALITRTSPSTWTMASSGVASTGLDCGVDDVAHVTGTNLAVKRNGGFTVGEVSQPFSIQLRALP